MSSVSSITEHSFAIPKACIELLGVQDGPFLTEMVLDLGKVWVHHGARVGH